MFCLKPTRDGIDQMVTEVMKQLMFRFATEPMIGDTGLWNLLVRVSDKRVVGIDTEEQRSDALIEQRWMDFRGAKRAETRMEALGHLLTSSRGLGKNRLPVFVVMMERIEARRELMAFLDRLAAESTYVSAKRIGWLRQCVTAFGPV
jgi:hypothetical protein